MSSSNEFPIFSKFDTGDILLFGSDNSIISSLIRWWCDSKWSHVGIILKDPVYIDPLLKGYYLLESSYEDIDDAVDHIQKYGVQIVPLEDVFNSYNGYIYWRKLNHTLPMYTLNSDLTLLYDSIKNKPYDLCLYDLFSLKMNINTPPKISNTPLLNWFRYDHTKMDSFICSGLVAYIYTELEFLNKDTQWSECMPKYFSSENEKLKLLNCTLNKELKVN